MVFGFSIYSRHDLSPYRVTYQFGCKGSSFCSFAQSPFWSFFVLRLHVSALYSTFAALLASVHAQKARTVLVHALRS